MFLFRIKYVSKFSDKNKNVMRLSRFRLFYLPDMLVTSSDNVKISRFVEDFSFSDSNSSCTILWEFRISVIAHRFSCRRQNKKTKTETVKTNTATSMTISVSASIERVLKNVNFEKMFEITVVIVDDDVKFVENDSSVAVMKLRREMILMSLLEERVLSSKKTNEKMTTSIDFDFRSAVLDWLLTFTRLKTTE